MLTYTTPVDVVRRYAPPHVAAWADAHVTWQPIHDPYHGPSGRDYVLNGAAIPPELAVVRDGRWTLHYRVDPVGPDFAYVCLEELAHAWLGHRPQTIEEGERYEREAKGLAADWLGVPNFADVLPHYWAEQE